MGKTISYGKSIKMREEQPSSIEQIIDRYPSNEFNSITISTIPLLDVFFNHDMVKLLELKEDDAEYIFEYTLSPKKGKGKASCTDLMILGENINYCIEAKRTEGRYETVEKWLQKDNSKGNNRQTVLEGWLEYINQDLTLINILEEIKDIPYQMIHRLASACYVHNKTNTPTELIYLIFESETQSTDKKYKKDLENLKKITHTDIHIRLIYCEPEPSSKMKEFEKKVENKSDDNSELIINYLKNSSEKKQLFRFDNPKFISI